MEKKEKNINKDNKKENEKPKKEIKNITFHEIKFLFLFFFKLLLLPVNIVIHSFKKQPLEPVKDLIEHFKKEMFEYHKQPLILISINLLVYLSWLLIYNFFPSLESIWNLIFTSNKYNFYLLNLSFLAHNNFYHFIVNMFFLYFTAYLLSYRFNVIRLYFMFGFLINLLLFLTSFFINIPNNLGASGVISAFLVLTLIFYPFGFSIILALFYLFLNPILSLLTFLRYFDFFSDIIKIYNNEFVSGNTFILDHFYGFLVGFVYALLNWENIKGVSKIIFFLVGFFIILVIFKVILVSKILHLH